MFPGCGAGRGVKSRPYRSRVRNAGTVDASIAECTTRTGARLGRYGSERRFGGGCVSKFVFQFRIYYSLCRGTADKRTKRFPFSTLSFLPPLIFAYFSLTFTSRQTIRQSARAPLFYLFFPNIHRPSSACRRIERPQSDLSLSPFVSPAAESSSPSSIGPPFSFRTAWIFL